MLFRHKTPVETSSTERSLINTCAEIITEIHPAHGVSSERTNELRHAATEAYKTLLDLDTEEGDGHVIALRLRSDLEFSKNVLLADQNKCHVEQIVFNSYDCNSIDECLQKIPQAVMHTGRVQIIRCQPKVYRGLGWGDSLTLSLSLQADQRVRLEYSELLGIKDSTYAYIKHLEKPLLQHDLVLIHVVHGYKGGSDIDSETLQKRVSEKNPGASPLLIGAIDHDFGGYQYEFLLCEELPKILQIVGEILKTVNQNPREKILLDYVSRISDQQNTPRELENPNYLICGPIKLSLVSKVPANLESSASHLPNSVLYELSYCTTTLTEYLMKGIISEDEYVYGFIPYTDMKVLHAKLVSQGIEQLVLLDRYNCEKALHTAFSYRFSELTPSIKVTCISPSD